MFPLYNKSCGWLGPTRAELLAIERKRFLASIRRKQTRCKF